MKRKSRKPNQRTFQRFLLDRECILSVDGRQLAARATDISVRGVGLSLDGNPVFDAPEVTVMIPEINFEMKGQIKWVRNAKSGVRVGVERAGPIEGELRSIDPADLVRGLWRERRTGILDIHAGSSRKRLFFKDGAVIFSESDFEGEQLLKVLADRGKISGDECKRLLGVCEVTGKPQGAVLVETGLLTPKDLIGAVRCQVEEIILNLCSLESGSYRFQDGMPKHGQPIRLPLSVLDLLYRGVRDRGSFREPVSGFRKTWVVLSPAADGILRDIGLSESEKKIVGLIDLIQPIEDIIRKSPVEEEETLRVLRGLVSVHAVEAVEEDERPESAGTQRTADGAISPEEIKRIEWLYEMHKSLAYHDILGIERGAPPAAVKKAYYKLAKEFHPDSHRSGHSAEMRMKMSAIFASVNDAYRGLMRGGRQVAGTASAEETVDPVQRNRMMAKARFEEGKGHLKRQAYDDACLSFGQAAYLDGTVPDYHFSYGLSLIGAKKMKESETAIRKALELSPGNAEYLTELGNLYLLLGFVARARGVFEKVLQTDPSHAGALEGLRRVKAQS